jgi:hypothetical protein
MTTKDRDRLAKGPNPRARIAPPAEGERCPRCHQRMAKGHTLRPCLLCNPDDVPLEFRSDR